MDDATQQRWRLTSSALSLKRRRRRATVYINSIERYTSHGWPAMNARAMGYPFCCNPDCILHVHAGAPGVIGWGNWAELADGHIVGRSLYYGVFLCDRCRRHWRAVIAFVPEPGCPSGPVSPAAESA